MNQPGVTWVLIALLGLAEISDTIRKHLGEIMSPTESTLGGAGPNWKQFQSAQVPIQLASRSILVRT